MIGYYMCLEYFVVTHAVDQQQKHNNNNNNSGILKDGSLLLFP